MSPFWDGDVYHVLFILEGYSLFLNPLCGSRQSLLWVSEQTLVTVSEHCMNYRGFGTLREERLHLALWADHGHESFGAKDTMLWLSWELTASLSLICWVPSGESNHWEMIEQWSFCLINRLIHLWICNFSTFLWDLTWLKKQLISKDCLSRVYLDATPLFWLTLLPDHLEISS